MFLEKFQIGALVLLVCVVTFGASANLFHLRGVEGRKPRIPCSSKNVFITDSAPNEELILRVVQFSHIRLGNPAERQRLLYRHAWRERNAGYHPIDRLRDGFRIFFSGPYRNLMGELNVMCRGLPKVYDLKKDLPWKVRNDGPYVDIGSECIDRVPASAPKTLKHIVRLLLDLSMLLGHYLPLLPIDVGLHGNQGSQNYSQGEFGYESNPTAINKETAHNDNNNKQSYSDANDDPESSLRVAVVFLCLYAFIGLCLVVLWHGLNLYWRQQK